MDTDDISLEALQAQIDMSMSFAQGLVSSWIKPRDPSALRKKLDLENKLAEAAHRRPRLGVGATAPETGSAARDTARLKGQLTGGKRARDKEGPKAPTNQAGGEDEEESRAGAIKKKAKLDPFEKSNKKKKAVILQPAPVQAALSTSSQASKAGSTSAKSPSVQSEQLTSSSKKRKNKPSEGATADALVATLPDNEGSAIDPKGQVSSTPQCMLEKGKEPSQTPDDVIKLVSASSIRRRGPLSPSKHPAKLLDKPLLNLQEISDDSASEDEAGDSMPSSPKKKRRRRKKKKTMPIDPPAPQSASSTIKLLVS